MLPTANVLSAMPGAAKAVVWAVVSAGAFAFGQASVKLLSERLPPAELAFLRASVGVLLAIGTWGLLAELRRARHPFWFAARCILGVIAIYAFMDAIARIPLALASLVLFSRLLIVPALASLLLNERVERSVWGAVLVGLVGVAVALTPSLGEWRATGAISAFIAAIASAGSQVAVRRLAQANSAGVIVIVNSAAAGLLLAFPAAAVWVTPPLGDLPVLAALAGFALMAQYAAARAFAGSRAAFVASMDFLTVPMTAAIGFLVFREAVTPHLVIGSAAILASTLYISWHSTRHTLQLPKAQKAA
ncbi:EamA family transporter [Azospirillum sp. sgz302134]